LSGFQNSKGGWPLEKMASSPDILSQEIQMKMWKNTFPKIGESLSVKFLTCLELHVDQLGAL
jgi:hypothetical protein